MSKYHVYALKWESGQLLCFSVAADATGTYITAVKLKYLYHEPWL